MKKNNKGFTLIELLAVIVILAILAAAAIPAVTKYLTTARKGTYASNAIAAIDAVRNDVISRGTTTSTTYYLDATPTKEEDRTNTAIAPVTINELLEKKIEKSPFGGNFDESNSYVYVEFDPVTQTYTYSICLVDSLGNGFIDHSDNKGMGVLESTVTDDQVQLNGSKVCKPVIIPKP